VKTLTIMTALACALGWLGSAQAREADVQTFSGQPVGFQLLQPGNTPAAEVRRENDPSASAGLNLQSEFLGFGDDELPSRSSAGDLVYIPSWMRGGGAGVTGDFPARLSETQCGQRQYRAYPGLTAEQQVRRARFFERMVTAACSAGVPVDLFDALIVQESRYNPAALSPKGATGLTQLMPGTARLLGVADRWNVSDNLEGGARYLRQQLDAFGNWALALSAYNAGPANVQKYGGVPPFRETRAYVRKILASIEQHQQGRGDEPVGTRVPTRSVMLASFIP